MSEKKSVSQEVFRAQEERREDIKNKDNKKTNKQEKRTSAPYVALRISSVGASTGPLI